MRRERRMAKVAMARKLAVRLLLDVAQGWDYERLKKLGAHAGEPEIARVCSRSPAGMIGIPLSSQGSSNSNHDRVVIEEMLGRLEFLTHRLRASLC